MTQTNRDGGLNSTEKGKREGYFNNISKNFNLTDILFIQSSRGMGMSNQVAKDSFEGDKCPVEGMQYILLASVYLGGISFILSSGDQLSRAKD
jgi:hypothetical protein